MDLIPPEFNKQTIFLEKNHLFYGYKICYSKWDTLYCGAHTALGAASGNEHLEIPAANCQIA